MRSANLKNTEIHPTAVVHPWARIGERVKIGPYSVIGERVALGDECNVGSNVLIDGNTSLDEAGGFYDFVIDRFVVTAMISGMAFASIPPFLPACLSRNLKPFHS